LRYLNAAVLTALVFVLAAMSIPSSASASGSCSEVEIKLGTCPTINTGIDGDEAVIGGDVRGGGGSGGGGGGDSEDELPCQFPTCDPASGRGLFTVVTVSLSDLIGFRPAPGVDHMEPNGWTVAGLDTNFYATGGSQVQHGTLLGFPAAVRFTPILWHWTYGDGRVATHSTAGATWAAQHIREFDSTPTSHVYQRQGSYVIDLDVTYAVEYTFGGSDWADIDGTLTVPANRLTIVAGDAKTVLVQHECTVNPNGPGC
jgi:hypothetical protein